MNCFSNSWYSLLLSEFLASSRITSRRKPFKWPYGPSWRLDDKNNHEHQMDFHFVLLQRVGSFQKQDISFSGKLGSYYGIFFFGRTVTSSGQYFPVRPSRSVSKRLILWLESCTVLIYVLFFMSSTKKSPFLAVLTWFLIPRKIQDRCQDGDLSWWRHRPPVAPPSIKYTFSW